MDRISDGIEWRSEQQELFLWLFQQAGARGGPGLHGPPARRRGRLREPWSLDADQVGAQDHLRERRWLVYVQAPAGDLVRTLPGERAGRSVHGQARAARTLRGAPSPALKSTATRRLPPRRFGIGTGCTQGGRRLTQQRHRASSLASGSSRSPTRSRGRRSRSLIPEDHTRSPRWRVLTQIVLSRRGR